MGPFMYASICIMHLLGPVQSMRPYELTITDVPPRVAAAFKIVVAKANVDGEKAISELSLSSLAMVYFRFNSQATKELGKSTIEKVDKSHIRKLMSRLGVRLKYWAGLRRIDLLVESVPFLTEEGDRRILVNHICAAIEEIHAVNKENHYLSHFDPERRSYTKSYDELLKREYYVYSDDRIKLKSALEFKKIVLANEVEFRANNKFDCMFCIRDRIIEPAGRSAWSSCIVLTNDTIERFRPRELSGCLLVVDGDLELDSINHINDSMIFVNGKIGISSNTGIGKSYLMANGTVKISRGGGSGSTVFNRGKIDVHENSGLRLIDRDEPFGIRFFQLSDVGIAAKAHPKGAEITAISPFSPLRLFGLRVGDVVTKVDDRAIDSPDALRRATRTAYVREAGVYYLLRNGQAIDRIVLFGDYQLPK